MWRVRGRSTGKISYQRKVLTTRPALGAYIGFLGVIWFTWLQVTLFDVRFARDSVFERVCKAAQLAVMVGFASAGTRFTTRVQGDNVWAFQSLSLLLAGSRTLLAIQYTFNRRFFRGRMEDTSKGMKHIVAILGISSVVYLGVSLLPPYRHDILLILQTVCSCSLPSRNETEFRPTYGPFGLRYLGSRCGW